MKKFVLSFVLALLLLFSTACVPTKETSMPITVSITEPKDIPTDPPTDPPTEKPTQKPTEKPTEKTDVKLYEDENVHISFASLEKSQYQDDEIEVNFLVRNKLNEKLTFQADTVTINGISYNKILMSDPVAPDSTGVITMDVEDAKYISPSEIGAEIRYFNDYLSPSEIHINVSIPRTKIN